MGRLLTAAAYAMHNMPIGTAYNAPVLTDEEAYDVAAYLISQQRPFRSGSRSRSEQHKFGPFRPVRAKVQELAAASRTVKAGEPDNGSDESDRAK
jgi:thiosulfate dehydrogenase